MADVNANVRPTYWWGQQDWRKGLSDEEYSWTQAGEDKFLNGDWMDSVSRAADKEISPAKAARLIYITRLRGYGGNQADTWPYNDTLENWTKEWWDEKEKLKNNPRAREYGTYEHRRLAYFQSVFDELKRLEDESAKSYNESRSKKEKADKEKADTELLKQLKSYGLNDKQTKAAARLIKGYGSKSETDKQRIREHFAKVLPRNVVAEDGDGGLTLRTLTGEEQEQKRLRALRFSDEDVAAIMAAQSAIDPNDPESVRLATEEVNARLGEGKSGLTATFNPETGTFAYARTKAESGRPKFYTEQAPEKSVREKLDDTINMANRLVERIRGPRSEAPKPDGRGVKPPQAPLERWRAGNERTFAEKRYMPDATNVEHTARGMSELLSPETRQMLAAQIQRGNDIREQTPFYGVTDDSRRLRVVDPGAVTAQGTFRYDYNTRKLAEQMRQRGLMLGETPSGAIVPVRIDENNQPQIVNARGFTPRDMMMRRPVETRSREQMMFDAMERAQATGQYNPRTAAAFARRLDNGTLNLPQLSNEQLAARERWRTAELARQAGGGQRAGSAMQLQMENSGTMWTRQQAANPRMENPYEAAYRQQQAAFAARQRAAEAEAQAYQTMQNAAQSTLTGGVPQNPQAAAGSANNAANPKQPTVQRSPRNPQ